MTTYEDDLNGQFDHTVLNCKGRFKHLLLEDALVPVGVGVRLPHTVKIASFAVCEECDSAYFTRGFEHWLETYRAFKLMDKQEPLTEEEKKFLRLHFQLVDGTFEIHHIPGE